MKRLFLTLGGVLLLNSPAYSQDEVKIGILLGITGPIESLAAEMVKGGEYAFQEANESGMFLGGAQVTPVIADATCIDSAAATAAAERIITSDGVKAIVGAACSGVTGAVLQNVARPNGIVMISPSATSPGLSTAEDDGLFFRTSPSDARQGAVMSEILNERGIKEVAVTYTNNDYGKGLADSFQASYEASGGIVTISTAHEDGKGDYSAEVGALAAAGGEVLVVAGYLDQGGQGIVQASLDSGAFDTFVLPDGMIGTSLIETIGSDLNGSFGQAPGTDSPGSEMLLELGSSAGFDGTSPFVPETYDAAALIMLAMQASGSTDSCRFQRQCVRCRKRARRTDLSRRARQSV